MKKFLLLFLFLCTTASAAEYQLTLSPMIMRESDGLMIPPDPKNADYQAEQVWVSRGNSPDPYVAPAQTAQQKSASALSAGLNVESSGNDDLNGTYGLDQISQDNVNATVTYILMNGTFPGGGTTMPWVDQSGATHIWPDVAEFKAFATAYANYVADVSLYAASNGASGALPSNSVTIP